MPQFVVSVAEHVSGVNVRVKKLGAAANAVSYPLAEPSISGLTHGHGLNHFIPGKSHRHRRRSTSRADGPRGCALYSPSAASDGAGEYGSGKNRRGSARR